MAAGFPNNAVPGKNEQDSYGSCVGPSCPSIDLVSLARCHRGSPIHRRDAVPTSPTDTACPESMTVRRARLGKYLSRNVAAHGRLLTSAEVRRACRPGRSTRHDRRARRRGTAPRGARSTRLVPSRRTRLAREGPRPRRGCRPCRPRSSRTCRPADNPWVREARSDRGAERTGRATARAAWTGRATGCSDRGREQGVFRGSQVRRSRSSTSPSSGRTSRPRSRRASPRHPRRSGRRAPSPSRGRRDRRSRDPPRNIVRRDLQARRERESSSECRGATRSARSDLRRPRRSSPVSTDPCSDRGRRRFCPNRPRA